MKRMAASNVLIIGVKGLGVEIGKQSGTHFPRLRIHAPPCSQKRRLGGCQVCDSVRSRASPGARLGHAGELSIQVDSGLVAHGLQFFLRESDVGKPRAAATLPRLAELNAYVPVRDLGGSAGQEITVDLIKGFQASCTLSVGCMRVV